MVTIPVEYSLGHALAVDCRVADPEHLDRDPDQAIVLDNDPEYFF